MRAASIKQYKYLPRLIDSEIERYLPIMGAICIEGPKWCGKTWTASFHSGSRILISDPAGNFQNRSLAELSPALVLEGKAPRLIDEWQEAPSIWDAVRQTVDQRGQSEQFILTGSATPKHKGISHSGADQIGRLRMRPMSLYESGDSSGKISLRELCTGELAPVATGETDLRMLARLTVRGGWPDNLATSDKNLSMLPNQYLNAAVEDASRIDGIRRDNRKIKLLLRSLARSESAAVPNSRLKKHIKENDNEDIDVETITSYLDVLRRIFITDNQDPCSAEFHSSVRIKKAPKRHLCDTSLACALLGATPVGLIEDLQTFDFLFEALCERDLKIYAQTFDARLCHYQDYAGNKMDAVIELPDGAWCGIEIRLGANKIDEAAANLKRIRDMIVKDGGNAPSALMVICGMSNAAYQRPDGVLVAPITALKN
ncbi:MAG: ATP-binding protein [Succinivibrionaceae bacterium]|nr:ATP-binding protein [Succinivibrionaceae bacterium]